MRAAYSFPGTVLEPLENRALSQIQSFLFATILIYIHTAFPDQRKCQWQPEMPQAISYHFPSAYQAAPLLRALQSPLERSCYLPFARLVTRSVNLIEKVH